MSGSGIGMAAYLVGGSDGNPVIITDEGNMGVQDYYDKIVNNGRIVVRSTVPYRLPDIPATFVEIYNKEGNDTIWLAGYGSDAPSVGLGLPITEGASVKMPVFNSNQLSIIAENDGDEVFIITESTESTLTTTPSDPLALDKVGPTITSTVPATGAVSVAHDAGITITANKALDSSSITTTTVTISPAVTDIAVVPDPMDSTKILMSHVTNLAASTLYTVTVTTGVTNAYGYAIAAPYVFTFTTAAAPPPPDTTPPTVSSSNPTHNAVSVTPSLSPTITFNEAVLLSSITSTSIKVYTTSPSDVLVPDTTYGLSVDNKTVTISSLTLSPSTAYRIDILGGTGGVADLAGNLLATTYSISFTTGAALQTVYTVTGASYDAQRITDFPDDSIKIDNASSLLKGRIGKRYTPTMKTYGSPTGNVTLVWQKWVSGSTYTDYRTLGTIPVASIGATDTSPLVDDSTNTEAFGTGDKITVRYSGGDLSNYILVKYSVTDAFDGTNTYKIRTLFNGGEYVYTSQDLAMTIECQSI